MTKLIDYLYSINDFFDGELSTAEFESKFGFCWADTSRLTDEGIKKFKKILQSEIKILRKDTIILQSKDITEDEYDLFMAAAAGYVANSLCDKWFKEVEFSPSKEEV